MAGAELQGPEGLDQLGRHRARAGVGQAGDLHGDGRGAADDAARPQVDPQGAQNGDGVDSGVAAETPVLGVDQGRGQLRGYLVQAQGEAPHSVLGQEEAQRSAVAVQDARGEGRFEALFREGEEAVQDDPEKARHGQDKNQGGGSAPDRRPEAHAHGAGSSRMMRISLKGPSARRLGTYMASAWTGGQT